MSKFKKAGKAVQVSTRMKANEAASKNARAARYTQEMQTCTPARFDDVPAVDDKVLLALSRRLNKQIAIAITDPLARGWFKLFNRLDKDGSGKISFDEFAAMVRKELRMPQSDMSTDELIGAWKAIDGDPTGAGLITAGEFGQFMKRGQPEKGIGWRERNVQSSKSKSAMLDKDFEERCGKEVTKKLKALPMATNKEVAAVRARARRAGCPCPLPELTGPCPCSCR